MKQQIDAGQKFGMMTIIEESARKNIKRRRFLCRCDCGKEKESDLIHLTQGNTVSCGCKKAVLNKQRTRENSFTWKGGRYEDGGYILIYNPGRTKTSYTREHILVMEEHLGRRLTKDEEIHHKNGIKNDNRLSNLELWSKSHPAGQRVIDKVLWAKEIIKFYKDFDNE